jgi:AcrR family transcriptional regulator
MVAVMPVLRDFALDNPALAGLMFSRAFAEFDPGPGERRAGAAVREFIVARVRRCIDAGAVAGDPADVAHVLLAVAQGLILQETAGWLGTSRASMDRRWDLAAAALADGLSAAKSAG